MYSTELKLHLQKKLEMKWPRLYDFLKPELKKVKEMLPKNIHR